MNERKNIDRLFQEKFKDFEAAPSEKVWKGIESKLKEKKKDRKVVPFWLKLSGIAAALILAITATNEFYNPVTHNQNNIVIEEKNNIQQNADSLNPKQVGNNSGVAESESDKPLKTLDTQKNPNRKRNSNTESIAVSSDKKTNENQLKTNTTVVKALTKSDENRIAKPSNQQKKLKIQSGNEIKMMAKADSEKDSKFNLENVPHNPNSYTNQPITFFDKNNPDTKTNPDYIIKDSFDIKKKDSTALASAMPNALEELLKEKENPAVTKKEAKLNKWQISSNVAPIYFNSTSSGSPLDPEFAQNNKEYKSNLAYGLGVRYALNEKFTIRTGVNTIGLEYATNDVYFSQNTNARELEHVKMNVQGSMLQFENKNAGMPEISPNSQLVKKFEATLNQKTGYIEVPLELSYKIMNRKFGIEIIGGLSTLFLNENEISLVTSGTEMQIGKATNLNNTHFSTNVGLGVKYNFFKSFQANIEPMFKYQINTFTDSGNFKPYFFGLYTGINYRF